MFQNSEEMRRNELDELFCKVLGLIRRSPEEENDEIYRALVADGVDAHLASQLVVFLPMAYCRILLAHSGAKFSETFCRRLPDGRVSAEPPFSSEPLWNAALAFARAEINPGVSLHDLLAVAGRSAEFDAVNQLLKSGSGLRDIVFTPPVLFWPEGERLPNPQS